ncbi:MAG: tRNA pseudouridine(55) synthase TruB [Flavobacteriales bacterium]|nr:tRNA pseudouridine(55) synthase TruB [Flavobacteriales bacterium]
MVVVDSSDQKYIDGQTLLINKPLEWTSFDVVNKLRYQLKRKLNVKKLKVGHAGTLDPLATGLLIICTGKSTKQIDTIQAQEKEYTGVITLGGTTPSYDLETEVDQTFDYAGITEEEILKTAQSFIGESEQMPPIFSAKKINGKKAYDLARKGKEVKLNPRSIVISLFEIEKIELPDVYFKITCSKGTYIRSIAFDFGQKLDNGGHLSKLCRTKIGDYNLENAFEIEQFVENLWVE